MKRNQLLFALSIVLVLILGNPAHCSAQSNTATLSGAVTDPQGLGVKSAKVTLVNKSTGAERTASTDENGRYTFVSLAPGTYTMTVDGGSGFSNFTAEDLMITVGQDAVYNLTLGLHGVQQTVTVTSKTVAVETSK